MYNAHSPHSPGPFDGIRNVLGCLTFIARAGAASVEVFLHRRFGERYLGAQAAAVLLLIPLFGLFWQGRDLRPLMAFWAAYLFMCLVARIDVVRRRRRGDREHSLYNGWPRLLRQGRLGREYLTKQFIEPVLVAGLGMAIHGSDEPLGGYLMFGALCLFVTNGMMRAWEERRVSDMHDALLNQQFTAERFRELQGR